MTAALIGLLGKADPKLASDTHRRLIDRRRMANVLRRYNRGILADAENAAIPRGHQGGDEERQGQSSSGEEVVDAAATSPPARQRQQRDGVQSHESDDEGVHRPSLARARLRARLSDHPPVVDAW